MAAPMKRNVGWFNREEWECVYHDIYSGNEASQRRAVERLAVWKHRMGHKLSTSIECTWLLLSCQMTLSALQRGTSGTQRSEQEVRLQCAMALIRFVNLLTEKSQNRQYAQPVHVVAEELGLPEWLVDLRHDATHSNLPTLPVLESSVQFALTWLKEWYWEASREHYIEEVSSRKSPSPYSKENLRNILAQYLEQRFQDLESADTEKSSSESLHYVLIDLEQAILADRKLAVDMLLEEGHLVPTAVQMERLQFSATDLRSTDSLDLPPSWVQLWRPLLKLCHTLRLTPHLVQTALQCQSTTSTLQDYMYAAWAATLLAANTKDSTLSSPAVQELSAIYHHPCHFKSRELLLDCLHHPNKFTSQLLTLLFPLQDPQLSDHQQLQLKQLCNLFAGQTQTPSHDAPVRTLSDLLAALPSEDQDSTSDMLTEQCVPDYEDVNWSQYPLGCCPGQQMTYTSLELPSCPEFQAISTHNPDITEKNETDLYPLWTDVLPPLSPTRLKTTDTWTPTDLRHITSGIKEY